MSFSGTGYLRMHLKQSRREISQGADHSQVLGNAPEAAAFVNY